MSTEARLPQPTNQRQHLHIFISYSSRDKVAVSQLAEAIKADGNPVWIDNVSVEFEGYLVGGEEWQKGLANALNHAMLVVLAMSPDSMASAWVGAEIQRAKELGLTIIPVLIRPLDDKSKASWQALQLDQVHNRDLTSNYKYGLESLLDDIGRHSKSIRLTNKIIHTNDSKQTDYIVELLDLMLQEDTNATENVCRLLGMKDGAIRTNLLRKLKSHPVAKALPAPVVKVLEPLCTHHDVLIAGWARELISC